MNATSFNLPPVDGYGCRVALAFRDASSDRVPAAGGILLPLAGNALDVASPSHKLGRILEGAPSSVSASARSLARRTDAESRPLAAPFATARIPTAGSSQTTAGPDGETSSAQVAAEQTPERASATARANADWRAPTDARRAAGETGRAGRRTGQAARREAPPVRGSSESTRLGSPADRSHRLAGGGGVSLHEPDGRPSHASVARATAGARRPFPATGRTHEDALAPRPAWERNRERSAGR